MKCWLDRASPRYAAKGEFFSGCAQKKRARLARGLIEAVAVARRESAKKTRVYDACAVAAMRSVRLSRDNVMRSCCTERADIGQCIFDIPSASDLSVGASFYLYSVCNVQFLFGPAVEYKRAGVREEGEPRPMNPFFAGTSPEAVLCDLSKSLNP